jgi:very-short-patch-repair endonuclease
MFMQKPNLFNVAITRGRNKVINFVSRNPRELPDGHFRNYVSYMQEYQNRQQAMLSGDIDENIYKNSFEREVAEKIRELDHKVVAGADIAGLSADLLVDDKFIVEIDGVQDKQTSRLSNMKKQAIMERSGYKVKRITYREWHYSPKACLDRVLIDE